MNARPESKRLYRVKVGDGGSFLYDVIDVARLFRWMAEAGDPRPITVRPARTRWYL